ncbi:MAG: hypothetical protein K2H10_07305, partial [Bacteroidales bacterium]|nr:hypothetical protein [Bacteroidales bacterium]
YHVMQGYAPDDNTVTVASALMWGNNMSPSSENPEVVAELMAWDISERCQFALGSGRQYTYRTILMTEPVAQILKKVYPDKDLLEDELASKARRPLRERAYAGYHANPGSRIDPSAFPFRMYEKRIARTEGAELTPCPQWYAAPDGCQGTEIMTVPVMKPGMTAMIITGDSSRNKVQIMPGGGYSTVRIELPPDWDALIQEAGYEPLETFHVR